MNDGEYDDGVEAADAAEGRRVDAAYDRQEAGIAASTERAIASFLNASRDAAANDVKSRVESSLAERRAADAAANLAINEAERLLCGRGADDIALKVAQVSGEEEAKAVVDHVREQRDLLAKAAQATVMFLRCGGLVTRTDVETWRALTGSSDFSLRGVEQFVREQMWLAGVTP